MLLLMLHLGQKTPSFRIGHFQKTKISKSDLVNSENNESFQKSYFGRLLKIRKGFDGILIGRLILGIILLIFLYQSFDWYLRLMDQAMNEEKNMMPREMLFLYEMGYRLYISEIVM